MGDIEQALGSLLIELDVLFWLGYLEVCSFYQASALT